MEDIRTDMEMNSAGSLLKISTLLTHIIHFFDFSHRANLGWMQLYHEATEDCKH